MADAGWKRLNEEMQRWHDLGQAVRLWWRDDDAIEPTSELERLIMLIRQAEAPLALAVIPAHASGALAERLSTEPLMRPVMHGWRHDNHEPVERKKCEFGSARQTEALRADLSLGRENITRLFGASAARFFVPPWNRISPQSVSLLPEFKIQALSGYGEPGLQRRDHLRVLNTHIDPIDWRGSQSLVAEQDLVARLVGLLVSRRESNHFDDPIGFLTHHLVHDSAIWNFCERLCGFVAAHPSADWYDAYTIVGLFEDQTTSSETSVE